VGNFTSLLKITNLSKHLWLKFLSI